MSIKDPHELRAIFQLAYATQRQLFEAGLVLNETPSDAVIDEARGVVEDIKLTEGHVNIKGQMAAATSSVIHNWTERQAAHIQKKQGERPPKQDEQQQLVEMFIRQAGVKIVSTNGRNITLMFDTDKDAKAARKLWQDNQQGLHIDLYADKE
jgi:hypothetical protein